jgi:hypothetical protein
MKKFNSLFYTGLTIILSPVVIFTIVAFASMNKKEIIKEAYAIKTISTGLRLKKNVITKEEFVQITDELDSRLENFIRDLKKDDN